MLFRSREGEDADNAKYYSEQSKLEADRAKTEADRAASIVGLDIDAELSTESTNPVQNKAVAEAIGQKLSADGDASNLTVTFDETAERETLSSGDKLSVIAGKIKKWLNSLSPVALSGKYTDLSEKPDIPTIPSAIKNPKALTFSGAVTGSYDGSTAMSVAIPTGTNSLTAKEPGTWLDATQGEVLKGLHDKNAEDIAALTSNLSDWVNITNDCSWKTSIVKDGVYRSYMRYNRATKQIIGVISVNGGTEITNQSPIVELPKDIVANHYTGMCGIGAFSNQTFVAAPRVMANVIYSSHSSPASLNIRNSQDGVYLINFIAE